MIEGSQDLNTSRFLVEEINLDDEPTEEEVLERAEDLDIDDLFLARESLTQQLDPEWKPYCNRFGDIYYISLTERKAYIDHPIDMQYKKIYAKNNQMPTPRFRSFHLEEIAQSLDLIEKEIRSFNSHSTTLRVVYEEPSEEEAVSSHSRTPNHLSANQRKNLYFENEEQDRVVEEEECLPPEELAELLAYKSQIEAHYEEQLREAQKQFELAQIQKSKAQQKRMERIVEQRVGQICAKHEQQIRKKNKINLEKQAEKIQEQNSEKINKYSEYLLKFNETFDQLRRKQRNNHNIKRQMEILENINATEQINQNKKLLYHHELAKLKAKIIQQYDIKFTQMIGGSQTLQNLLKKDLEQLLNPTTTNNNNQSNILAAHSYLSADIPLSVNKQTHSQLPIKPPSPYFSKEELMRNKRQSLQTYQHPIAHENVWSQLTNQSNNKLTSFSKRASLNTRLRMRII